MNPKNKISYHSLASLPDWFIKYSGSGELLVNIVKCYGDFYEASDRINKIANKYRYVCLVLGGLAGINGYGSQQSLKRALLSLKYLDSTVIYDKELNLFLSPQKIVGINLETLE